MLRVLENPASSVRGLDILVVDSPTDCTALEGNLTALGHRVYCCASLQEALEYLSTYQQPDLVIAEPIMSSPQDGSGAMTGLDLIQWIRAAYPNLKVIAFSRRGGPLEVLRARLAGARFHIAKNGNALDDILLSIQCLFPAQADRFSLRQPLSFF